MFTKPPLTHCFLFVLPHANHDAAGVFEIDIRHTQERG